MAASLIEHFSSLPDHRIDRNKFNALIDIIVLAICAVASGADGWEAIEQFGKEKLEWLRRYILLANGVPSHDCIAYVLCRLSAAKFRDCFMSWTQAVTRQTGGEVITVDGKTAKGSTDRKNHRNPLHRQSVLGPVRTGWCSGNRPLMKNPTRFTAIPKLLALLELSTGNRKGG